MTADNWPVFKLIVSVCELYVDCGYFNFLMKIISYYCEYPSNVLMVSVLVCITLHCITFKALTTQKPQYLAELICYYEAPRQLRSLRKHSTEQCISSELF